MRMPSVDKLHRSTNIIPIRFFASTFVLLLLFYDSSMTIFVPVRYLKLNRPYLDLFCSSSLLLLFFSPFIGAASAIWSTLWVLNKLMIRLKRRRWWWQKFQTKYGWEEMPMSWGASQRSWGVGERVELMQRETWFGNCWILTAFKTSNDAWWYAAHIHETMSQLFLWKLSLFDLFFMHIILLAATRDGDKRKENNAQKK